MLNRLAVFLMGVFVVSSAAFSTEKMPTFLGKLDGDYVSKSSFVSRLPWKCENGACDTFQEEIEFFGPHSKQRAIHAATARSKHYADVMFEQSCPDSMNEVRNIRYGKTECLEIGKENLPAKVPQYGLVECATPVFAECHRKE